MIPACQGVSNAAVQGPQKRNGAMNWFRQQKHQGVCWDRMVPGFKFTWAVSFQGSSLAGALIWAMRPSLGLILGPFARLAGLVFR